jgi:quercetin dioxygenase-like cupin family protein
VKETTVLDPFRLSHVPLVRPSGQGRHYCVLDEDVTCVFRSDDWALFSVITPPGSAVPPHVHDRYDEALYLLDGELQLQLGEDAFILAPGHFVHVPRSTVHSVRTLGEGPARWLSWSLPGLAEAFYAEVDEAQRSGYTALDQIVAIAMRHGTRLAGQPETESPARS